MPRSRKFNRCSHVVACVVLLFCGCSRDPNVRKMNFVHKGDDYFHKAEYPEALISYARALQIDPKLVEAQYKSAQCQLRLANWPAAFQSLSRTVELQPDNWPAQLDLAKLYLSGGGPAQAKEKAELILQNDPGNVDARILLSNAEAILGDKDDALKEAQEAVNRSPQRADVYTNLGTLQERAGLLSRCRN